MKKVLIVSLTLFLISSLIKGDTIRIPDEAIRFRVIANSDSKYDQDIKQGVRSELEKDLYNYLKDTNNVKEAKDTLKNNLATINSNIETTLKNKNVNYSYQVSLGKNHFPSKEYKGIIYDEGYYDSLVVTLGSGEGSNWWCVLFPPLCLMEAEENKTNEVEYKSYVKELINKYFD